MTWYQGPEGGGAPSSRFEHTANLVGGTKMIFFGGWNGNDFFNDVYVLDLEIMAWSKPSTKNTPAVSLSLIQFRASNSAIKSAASSDVAFLDNTDKNR